MPALSVLCWLNRPSTIVNLSWWTGISGLAYEPLTNDEYWSLDLGFDVVSCALLPLHRRRRCWAGAISRVNLLQAACATRRQASSNAAA